MSKLPDPIVIGAEIDAVGDLDDGTPGMDLNWHDDEAELHLIRIDLPRHLLADVGGQVYSRVKITVEFTGERD